jgi:hypothetical protein
MLSFAEIKDFHHWRSHMKINSKTKVQTLTKDIVKSFNNKELLASSEAHVKNERQAYEFTNWHFDEIQSRKLYISCGYESLYKMLVGFYKYCEASAYQRVRVINLIEEVPEIAESLNLGELNITNLDRAQSFIKSYEKKNNEVLNQTEKLELIENIKNKTTKEVKEYFARLDPETTLPPDLVKHLSEKHVQVSWTLEKILLEKLDYLKSLISHEYPLVTANDLMGLMLTETIKNVEKKKGVYQKPSRTKAIDFIENPNSLKTYKSSKYFISNNSRYISRIVKRYALAKANNRCEHVNSDGTRCPSTYQLQFDHIISFSKGGSSTLENIQMLCRVHNDFKSNH